MKTPKFTILSTLGNSLLVPLLSALDGYRLKPQAVIFDGKETERHLQIERNRLDPSYPFPEIHEGAFPDIPCHFVKNHNGEDSLRLIRGLGPGFLVNGGTPRRLEKQLLATTAGVLNCHPGLLPKYRGSTCVEWSIFHDDPVGASAHWMTDNLDDGHVLASEEMPVAPYEDYILVRTRMLFHQAALLAKVIASNPQYQAAAPFEAEVFKPIPFDKLMVVKTKLACGKYRSGKS